MRCQQPWRSRVAPRRATPYVRRHRHLSAVVSAAVLLAVIAATPLAWAALNDQHTEGRWTLVKAPASIPLGLKITIDDQHLSGQGLCNGFGSRWSQDDGPTGAFTSTAVGCGAGRDEQEDAYYSLLTGTTSVHVVDGQLVLSGKAGTLVYHRRNSVPSVVEEGVQRPSRSHPTRGPLVSRRLLRNLLNQPHTPREHCGDIGASHAPGAGDPPMSRSSAGG